MNTDDELKLKLLQETARMPWLELQRFFAAGTALYIAPTLDLVDIACWLSQDDTRALAPYIEQNMVHAVSDQQAGDWFAQKTILWTLVVKPWVLVQPTSADAGTV
ncbi:MAG: DUF2288 domain-containing protein [Pseudomonadales bacterium]|nr:DUF2288 domain-containing protein [Pseudomonadales bacterium]